MKITQLPKATAVTDSDIAVIVQDGETRQIPRTLLAPPAPDDISIDGDVIRLSVDGEAVGNGIEIPPAPDDISIDGDVIRLSVDGTPVGTGAELPIPAPWAKQITYNRDTLGEKMELACLRETDVNRNTATISIYVFLNCAVYTETGEDNISVTPLLSDYRGINHSDLTSFALDENFLDISETFHFLDSDTMHSLSVKDLESLATDLLAKFRRKIEVLEFSDDGKLLLGYQYIFVMDTTQVTETEIESIHKELETLFEKSTAAFTVRYAEISYNKNAEVIGNV